MADLTRLNRTRRAPVAFLTRQHAAPSHPLPQIPSVSASDDGAATAPCIPCPFHSHAESQTAPPPVQHETLQAVESHQVAAAEEAAAWAPHRDEAAQVRQCAPLHAIFYYHGDYYRYHRNASCSENLYCTRSSSACSSFWQGPKLPTQEPQQLQCVHHRTSPHVFQRQPSPFFHRLFILQHGHCTTRQLCVPWNMGERHSQCRSI